MSNTVCLVGPPFSLVGKETFTDENASFSVTFDANGSDLVTRYQWYLDGLLMKDQRQSSITFSSSNGKHSIGVRILSAEGWSGIRSFVFRSYPQPIYRFDGPSSIKEGSNGTFNVTAILGDGRTEDYTSKYIFQSTEGTFAGNVLTIPNNAVTNDGRSVSITAKRSGYPDLAKTVVIINTTPVVVVNTEIVGPEFLLEGSNGTYTVVSTFNDQSKVTETGYVFTASEGTFVGNVLSIAANNVLNDERTININATKAGQPVLTKAILIKNTTQPTVIDLIIEGPTTVSEGQSYPYFVRQLYNDGTSNYVTGQTTLSINLTDRALFTENMLSVYSNSVTNDGVAAIITASFGALVKHLSVTIVNQSVPFEFTSQWAFTDTGALNNNPSGGTRTYGANNMPIGALWSINPSGLGLRISYEDSQNCVSPGTTGNNLVQSGQATATISVTANARIRVTWTGLAERHSTGFENATITIDGNLLGKASSPGGGLGCMMGPVIPIQNLPNGLSIAPGPHELSINCTTADPLYHIGAYYQFEISLVQEYDDSTNAE